MLTRPIEDINGRLEHLRAAALGIRNLTNYTAMPLLKPAASGDSDILDCEEPS